MRPGLSCVTPGIEIRFEGMIGAYRRIARAATCRFTASATVPRCIQSRPSAASVLAAPPLHLSRVPKNIPGLPVSQAARSSIL
jgi:hypothetical protein